MADRDRLADFRNWLTAVVVLTGSLGLLEMHRGLRPTYAIERRYTRYRICGHATERIVRGRLDARLASELDETRIRALRLKDARASDDTVLASLPLGQLSPTRQQQPARVEHDYRTRTIVT